jgi:GNAT superfamily N-acetyltransferase
MDRHAVIFGYYHNDPIAFYVMVPDLNPLIRNFKGKMNLLHQLKLMFDLKITKKCNRLIGLIFGVVPEHQGKGVESALVVRFEEEIFSGRVKYTDLEMNWIGDFNPGMMKLVEQIGGTIHKKHITYRYLFDPSKKFERARRTS